jgi:hypothetical protein
MSRKFNAITLAVGAIAIGFVWLYNVSIQTDLIPTIVNGDVIATSTGIIFTGIFFTLGCSNRLLGLQKEGHPKFILGFLGISSFFVVTTFLFIIVNDFGLALKLSFTGLIFASGTFMSLIALLIQQMSMEKNAA